MSDDLIDYDSVFGTPSYEKKVEEAKWRRQRLKVPVDGESYTEFVCRIIPPVKSCRNSREWYVQHEEFYGYNIRDKLNKSKTKSRPFTIKGFYDKHKNPAMQKIYAMKREMAEVITRLSANGKTQDEINLEVDSYRKWLKQHNKDTKYNINVYDVDGRILVLQLTTKAFAQLDQLIDKLQKNGVDPLDPKSGAWFIFTRTGNSDVLSTISDTVDVQKEIRILDGGIRAEVMKTAPISPEMARKIRDCAPDLRTEITRPLTLDLVEKLVNGPEDPDFVENIWKENDSRSKKENTDLVNNPKDPSEEFFRQKFGE